MAAGALAGARDSFGAVGAEWTNLAQTALGGLTQSQETAARVLEAQNSDWRQLARDLRDISKAVRLQPGPYHSRVTLSAADQQEDGKARADEAGSGGSQEGGL